MLSRTSKTPKTPTGPDSTASKQKGPCLSRAASCPNLFQSASADHAAPPALWDVRSRCPGKWTDYHRRLLSSASPKDLEDKLDKIWPAVEPTEAFWYGFLANIDVAFSRKLEIYNNLARLVSAINRAKIPGKYQGCEAEYNRFVLREFLGLTTINDIDDLEGLKSRFQKLPDGEILALLLSIKPDWDQKKLSDVAGRIANKFMLSAVADLEAETPFKALLDRLGYRFEVDLPAFCIRLPEVASLRRKWQELQREGYQIKGRPLPDFSFGGLPEQTTDAAFSAAGVFCDVNIAVGRESLHDHLIHVLPTIFRATMAEDSKTYPEYRRALVGAILKHQFVAANLLKERRITKEQHVALAKSLGMAVDLATAGTTFDDSVQQIVQEVADSGGLNLWQYLEFAVSGSDFLGRPENAALNNVLNDQSGLEKVKATWKRAYQGLSTQKNR